jgi:hypothetical protein
MKLIASNHDYYDHFARDRRVSDQTYLYERKPRIQVVDFSIPQLAYKDYCVFHSPRRIKPEDPRFYAGGFVVWFCGSPVPVVKVVKEVNLIEQEVSFYYSFDEIPDEIKGENPTQGSMGKWRRRSGFLTFYEELEDLFSLGAGLNGWERTNFKQPSKWVSNGRVFQKISIQEMHRIVGSPVFCTAGVSDGIVTGTYESKKWGVFSIPVKPCVLVNPLLADIEFGKHMDSFQAFLAIERYISNEMAPVDKRMDQPIPDELKAKSKGFDKKSFRKEPSTKKKR